MWRRTAGTIITSLSSSVIRGRTSECGSEEEKEEEGPLGSFYIDTHTHSRKGYLIYIVELGDYFVIVIKPPLTVGRRRDNYIVSYQ